MITRLAIVGGIEAYQRILSPVKGFCCAHRFVHGGVSCSEYVRRAVLRFGPVKAFALANRRFGRCREAYALLSEQAGTDSGSTKMPDEPLAKVCVREVPGHVCVGCCPWV